MKAARIHAYGHSDQVHIEEIPEPNPAPNEVLIRIRAAGINPIDWKIREGLRKTVAPRTFPFTLGQDFCGEVVALGRDVSDVDVEASDEVYGFANGAYAELAVVTLDLFASKPLSVDDVTAASLPTPGLTALQAVRDHVAAQAGQLILIHGAAGAVGAFATQLVLAKGARVIATASGRDAPYLQSLGVTRVIDYKAEHFEDVVSDVDAVIDLVGGDTLARSYDVVKRGGVLVTTVGAIDQARADAADIRTVRMWARKNRADLEVLARYVDNGVLEARGARVLPLAEAREGQELSESHREHGKLVLTVS